MNCHGRWWGAVHCRCWAVRNASDQASRRDLTCRWSSASTPASTSTAIRGLGSRRSTLPTSSTACASFRTCTKASSQESRRAVRAGESLGIRPSRTCGSSLGMGSDRCSNFIARSRNCSEVSIKDRRGTARRAPSESYAVSGPQSVPLQGPQNQAPSLNIIGSSQTGQFGGFSRGKARRASRSRSLSNSSAISCCVVILSDSEESRPFTSLRVTGVSAFLSDAQRFFGTLAGGHTDEFQFSVDDRGRRGPDRVPIHQFLSVRAEDVHLPIAEAVLDPQALPQLLRRRTRPASLRVD